MSSRFIVSEAMEHRSNYKKKWSLLTKGVGLKHGQQTNPKSITFCMNSYQSNLRQEAIDTLGASCIICGFSDSRALQFDHVEEGMVMMTERKSHGLLDIERLLQVVPSISFYVLTAIG